MAETMTLREKAEAALKAPQSIVLGSPFANALDVCRAYLESLPPADDEAEVDEAWLRSIGFRREMQPAAHNHLTIRAAGMTVTRWQNKVEPSAWSVCNDWLPPDAYPTTRGQVRALLTALGITTKQEGTP